MDPSTQSLYDYLAQCRSPSALGVISLSNDLCIAREHGLHARETACAGFQSRLMAALRAQDASFIIADDYICFVLNDLLHENHIRLAANKIESQFETSFRFKELEIQAEVHAGLIFFDTCEDHPMASRLYQLAESARFDAQTSHSIVRIHEPDRATPATRPLRQIEEGLAKAELFFDYQPKYRLSDGELVGAEALIRWRQGDFIVRPDDFLPSLTRQQWWELTMYCIRRALRDMHTLQTKVPVAINLDPTVLTHPELLDFISTEHRLWDIEPAQVSFEVTESDAIESYEDTNNTLSRLRDLGHSIAIDDFGTGQASLQHFRQLPADEIKIDRQFITNVATDPEDQKIVETILDLSHQSGKYAVAEGIENAETIEYLISRGCDIGQGYYLAMPMPLADYTLLLNRVTAVTSAPRVAANR